MMMSPHFLNSGTINIADQTVPTAISMAVSKINSWIENAFNSISSDTPIVRETWSIQQNLANAQIAGTATATQTALLQSMCLAGETPAQLAQKISAASAMMQSASAAIIGFKRTAFAAIYAQADASGNPTTAQDIQTACTTFLTSLNTLLTSLGKPTLS